MTGSVVSWCSKQRLQMRVAVVFAGPVVLVVGPCRRQLFEPFADVLDEPAFEVVDVDRGRDVHGRDEAQAVFHAAALDNLLHLVGDVHHLAPLARFKDQILRVTLHPNSLRVQCQGRASYASMWPRRGMHSVQRRRRPYVRTWKSALHSLRRPALDRQSACAACTMHLMRAYGPQQWWPAKDAL